MNLSTSVTSPEKGSYDDGSVGWSRRSWSSGPKFGSETVNIDYCKVRENRRYKSLHFIPTIIITDGVSYPDFVYLNPFREWQPKLYISYKNKESILIKWETNFNGRTSFSATFSFHLYMYLFMYVINFTKSPQQSFPKYLLLWTGYKKILTRPKEVHLTPRMSFFPLSPTVIFKVTRTLEN